MDGGRRSDLHSLIHHLIPWSNLRHPARVWGKRDSRSHVGSANSFRPSCLRRRMRVDMGPEAEVPEGGSKCVSVNQGKYALFRIGGKVYCLANECTHVGGPLCEGLLEDHVVECPLHGSRFDVRSGQVVGPPARVPVRSYQCTVVGGRVSVEVPRRAISARTQRGS